MGLKQCRLQPCRHTRGSFGRGMTVLAALPLLMLLQAAVGAVGQATPVVKDPVVINELLSQPANNTAEAASSWSQVTSSYEWFELLNTGGSTVDLSGWTMYQGPANSGGASWTFPSGTAMPAGAYLVVLTPRANDVLPPIPSDTNVLAASGIRLNRDGVFLYDASGNLAASTGGRLPEQRAGTTFGLPQGRSGNAAGAPPLPYTFLAQPTPFLENSGPASVGPFIHRMRSDQEGRATAGQPIVVESSLSPNQAPIAGATLLYRVNYGAEQQVEMSAGSADADGRVTHTGTIPASAFKAGDMVRWRVQARDSQGATTLEPNGLNPRLKQYEGAVVPVADEGDSHIPVLYWWAEDVNAATSQNGGASVLAYQGDFYDNVFATRRGVTALSWSKPKLNFNVQDDGFIIRQGIPPVTDLKLNSYWFELGENSFMKEVVAYQVLRDEGVIAPESFHIALYLNGQFYGLYGIIEEVDTNLLEHHNLPKTGPLFKSESGELSNLRWDLPIAEMPAYYSRPNRRSFSQDWQLLADFTKGLAGGGPGTRSSFLFDAANIPAVVNEAAIQTLLLNQDRCTKNFYVYYNPDSGEWIRIPWDVEASMGQDNTLGGRPGDLYCILACEQWNSPLYCDSEHPQDIGNIQTVWGAITAVGLNPYQGQAVQNSRGRRLLQANSFVDTYTKPLTWQGADDWNNPDRVEYGTKSVIGAQGTYNHLTDAILDVNATRQMYMRRLRNLAEKYYGQNKLREIVDATWNKISPVAARDNQVWQRGDGKRGYTQITTEFIPIRGKQLLELYGPGGQVPLLPGPQAATSSVVIGFGPSELTSDTRSSYTSFVLRSPADDAVDISGWTLTRQGGSSWQFPQGTVLVPNKPLHLTADVKGFRARSSSPKAGEAAFVQQVPGGLLPTDGGSGSWSITDATGAAVRLASG